MTSALAVGGRRAGRELRSPVVWLGLILVVLVGFPLGMLVIAAFTDSPPRPGAPLGNLTLDNFRALTGGGTRTAVWNTVLIAVGGTALAMTIGAGLAWLTVRSDMPARWLAKIAGVVPLFMSALVGTLAWSLLASPRSGYINTVLDVIGIPITLNVYTIPGIIVVMGIFYAPYTYLFAQSALSLVSPDLEEAANVHGASTPQTMRRITFPLVTPALVGAAILTFIMVSENFTVVEVLGSHAGIEAIPTRLYRLMNTTRGNPNEAAALGLVLVVVFALFIWAQRAIVSRRNFETVRGKGFRPSRVALGRWRWAATGLVAVYVFIAVVLPYFALAQGALRNHQFIPDLGSFFDPSAFALDEVRETLAYAPFRQGLRNSLLTAAGAAVAGGALNFALAYVARRTTLRGRGLLEYTTAIPLALPALVVGMALLWTWTRMPIAIYGTLFVLIVAFVVRFMPQGFQGVAATIAQVEPELEEAAVVAGASRPRATAYVTLPLVRSGVVSAVLLLFLLSMRELSAALLLFTSDTRLLSVVIYDQWGGGSWARVATMSLMYSAVLLVATIIFRKWLFTSAADDSAAAP